MPEILQTLEIERLVNLVKGFGWDKVSETTSDGKVVITVEKTIKPGVAVSPPE